MILVIRRLVAQMLDVTMVLAPVYQSIKVIRTLDVDLNVFSILIALEIKLV
jgi:hypothetical protein